MAQQKITKKMVDSLSAGDKDKFYWDTELKGFGLKLTPSGTKIYVVQYRLEGGRRRQPRRITIGRHGSPWAPELARQEARKLLASVALGEDPSAAKRLRRATPTVSEFCDIYIEQGVGAKKESTISTDRGRIERHIKPLLGKLLITDVTKADVRKFIQDIVDGKTAVGVKTRARGRARVAGGRGTATRTAGLLSGILSFAIEMGHIEINPVHGVPRFPDKKRERFLSLQEFSDIGAALTEMDREGVNPKALTIIRLLLLTGARRGEIEKLMWSEVDFDRRMLRLDDSKTGQKTIPLNSAAFDIISAVPRSRGNSRVKYVFQAESAEVPYSGTPRIWGKLRKRINAPDLRIHDLRHSFASVAVSQGASLPIIGALLGHKDVSTTQRYAHLSDDPLRAVSEAVGETITKVWEE